MEAHKNLPRVPGQEHTWREPVAPDIQAGITVGRLRSCSWCGSMHPADAAAALRAGAVASWADWKYGWPHKLYLDGVPNPHAGRLESRVSTSHAVPKCPKTGKACAHGEQSFTRPECECMKAGQVTEAMFGAYRMIRVRNEFLTGVRDPEYRWTEAGRPAAATEHGKFYTEHLQDATPEDREVIERAMGLRFTFDADAGVRWESFA